MITTCCECNCRYLGIEYMKINKINHEKAYVSILLWIEINLSHSMYGVHGSRLSDIVMCCSRLRSLLACLPNVKSLSRHCWGEKHSCQFVDYIVSITNYKNSYYAISYNYTARYIMYRLMYYFISLNLAITLILIVSRAYMYWLNVFRSLMKHIDH